MALHIVNVPREEWEEAMHFRSLVHNLDSTIQAFEKSLRLFDFCGTGEAEAARAVPSNDLPKDILRSRMFDFMFWKLIAAKEAAMTVYHFGIVIQAIRANNKRVPSLHRHIRHDLLRHANRAFRDAFPHQELLRNAISHAAELMQTVAHVNKNSINLRYGDRRTISNSLNGNTLIWTIDGKLVALDVTQRTAEILKEIAEAIYLALDPASEAARLPLRPFVLPLRN